MSLDQRQKHTVTYKPYVQPCPMDHDHKNMGMRRPMSPHLTIYAPTLYSLTSISQRISGVLAAVSALLLTSGALFLPNGIETYVAILQSLELSRGTAFLIKLIIGLPFAFHYANGIRFCMWNGGRWLAKKDLRTTAFKALYGAVIGAFIFALF